jgi:hypothetical protein
MLFVNNESFNSQINFLVKIILCIFMVDILIIFKL